MLSLQIAAGIVLAAIVLKFPRQIVRGAGVLVFVALVLGVSLGLVLWAGWPGMVGAVAIGLVAAFRRRQGLSLPRDQRSP